MGAHHKPPGDDCGSRCSGTVSMSIPRHGARCRTGDVDPVAHMSESDDSPLKGVYPRNEVYAKVTGWASFEPWLSRIEKLENDAIWKLAGEIFSQF